jgi:hypothetical protein
VLPPGRRDAPGLARLALVFLTIAAATEHTSPPPEDQIPFTRNEIAALFSALLIEPARDTGTGLRWSAWRRRQHRAKLATTSGKPPVIKIAKSGWSTTTQIG